MPVIEDQFVKVDSKEVAHELLEALCIPCEGIRSIKIDVTAGQTPTVTIETYKTTVEKPLTRSDSQGIKSVIKQYAFMEFVEGQDDDYE